MPIGFSRQKYVGKDVFWVSDIFNTNRKSFWLASIAACPVSSNASRKQNEKTCAHFYPARVPNAARNFAQNWSLV
jgi:hypothetical protein